MGRRRRTPPRRRRRRRLRPTRGRRSTHRCSTSCSSRRPSPRCSATPIADDIRTSAASRCCSQCARQGPPHPARRLRSRGRSTVQYCGAGDLDACRDALWGAVASVADELAVEYGDDTSTWLVEGARTTFIPGLIPDDFRSTNRPTFQQVIEWANR